MKGKKQVKSYKQVVVNTIILALILALLLYLGIQFSRNFSASLSTQRTQTVTVTDYKHLKAYVFRDESPILGSANTVCDYLVEDGSRVGVGHTYATLYTVSGEADKKQNELNLLSERIRRLRSKVSADGFVSELPHVNETIEKSYYAYINAILEGRLPAAQAHGDRLLDSIVDYKVIIGKEGEKDDVGALLEGQKSELVASFGASSGSLVADESFYLCYGVDGFERIFSSDKLASLTVDGLDSLISASPDDYESMAVGRAIHSAKWYFAIPVSSSDASGFTDNEGNALSGSVYEVTLTGSDKTVNMTLEELRMEDDGDGLLILSSYDLTVAGDLARGQSVKIKMSEVTGYRIPSEALAEQNGESGVYILIGTVVEFRRVTPLSEKNGYYIVKTYEGDDAEQKAYEESSGESDDLKAPPHDYGIPYLKANDLIITSGNDLYDGKLID